MYPYEDDLKYNLSNLGKIQDQINELQKQVDNIKNNIKTWMTMCELKDFQIEDTDSQLWKLSISSASRSNVNKDILPVFLNKEQLDKVINISNYTVFKCNRVRTFNSNSSTPKAPQQNYKKEDL